MIDDGGQLFKSISHSHLDMSGQTSLRESQQVAKRNNLYSIVPKLDETG